MSTLAQPGTLPALPAANRSPEVIVVRFRGDMGLPELGRLELELNRLVAMRPKVAVLDLASVASIACLAVGMLVDFRRAIVRAGGSVRLTAVQPAVVEALRRARVEELFAMNLG
jgi:anti-anti-sigma factor